MRMRGAVIVAAAAAGFGLAGCPSSSCPLESPQVSATPASCTVLASQPVSYPVRLCPTCNQTGASCSVDLSQAGNGGPIFLDIKVEACKDATSCGGAGCSVSPTTCSFTAPAAAATYQVIVYDAATGNPVTGNLVVIPSGAVSCALPTAGS